MKLIPSFTVDHTRLKPGIYISRIDTVGDNIITTYDIRLKKPNIEPCLTTTASHTLEHLIATFLRNDEAWKDSIIYWGPMGCLTGFYLIVKGEHENEEMGELMIRAFEFARDYEGEIPGATAESCGNYLLQNLAYAKYEAAAYVETLKKAPCYTYPE